MPPVQRLVHQLDRILFLHVGLPQVRLPPSPITETATPEDPSGRYSISPRSVPACVTRGIAAAAFAPDCDSVPGNEAPC